VIFPSWTGQGSAWLELDKDNVTAKVGFAENGQLTANKSQVIDRSRFSVDWKFAFGLPGANQA